MAAYFLCLTAGGGVPLFYRSRGNLKPLPFPIIGSLNGVHMFASTHGAELITTTTDTAKVVWKVYNNSLTLIIVSQDDHATDVHFTQLLDFIFQSMVLLYGLDDLSHIKNIERFKREIKVCYKMVDCLLEQSESATCGHIVNATDIIAAPENNILQTYLDAFVEAASSPYGCLVVDGRVAVATRKWWELAAVELVLLPLLIRSLPRCSSRDVPVFLPVGSPKVPHRLLTFLLTEGVEVCILCGPTPSLADLEREVGRFWRSAYDPLKSLARQQPRPFPIGLQVDTNILGLMLINTESHRCIYSVQPFDETSKKTEKSLSVTERRRVLCCFYRTVAGKVWRLAAGNSDTDRPGTAPPMEQEDRFSHEAQDTYVVADTHKCYATRQGVHWLLVLFANSVPTYAMRPVCGKTLQAFLHDKSVHL